MSERNATTTETASPYTPVTASRDLLVPIALLLLTAAILLLWSHAKLFWVDELLVLDTDSVPTAREVLHIQRWFPISLDPAVYHLFAHFCTRLFGPARFALRLPSMLGFLTMQATIYFFTRRVAGSRAALFALAFPAVSGALYYGADGRPYGLLLGIFGVVMLCYQSATRAAQDRAASLAAIALGLGLAENTHYFGIMLFLPVCGAELVRALGRRRLDWPMLAAIVAGAACEVFTLPFQHAAARYRQHYYNIGTVDTHALVRSYRLLLLNFQFSGAAERLSSALLLLFLLLIAGGTLLHRRRGEIDLPAPEFAFILLLAALPFAGFAMGRFVTHTMEVRYVLGAVLAIAVLFGLAVGPLLRQRQAYFTAAALMAAAVAGNGLLRIRGEQTETARIRNSLGLSAQEKQTLLGGIDGLIYLQNEGSFQIAEQYLTDPEIRSRLVMLYSFPRELRISGRDTNALTADHMRHFTGFRIVSWEDFRKLPGPHTLVVFHTGWDWAPIALQQENAAVQPRGPALGGDALTVQFSPSLHSPGSRDRP